MPTDYNDRMNDGEERPRRNAPRHSQPAQSGQRVDQGRRSAARQSRGAHAAAHGSQQNACFGQHAGAQGGQPSRKPQSGRRPAPNAQHPAGARQSGRHPAQQQQGESYAVRQPRAARPAQRSPYAQPGVQHSASGYGRSSYAQQQGRGYGAYSDDVQMVGSYGDSHEAVYRVRKKHRSHRVRNVVIGVVCVVLLLTVAAGVGGFNLLQSARSVKSDADQVLAIADGMMDKVGVGDMQGLAEDANSMASLASSMRSETDSPLWTVASFVPVYGSDISAARTLVAAFDDVANDALVPLTNDIQGISLNNMMSDGRINVEMFQTLATGLSNVSPSIKSANAQIQNIGETHIDQVTELVSTAKDAMGALGGAVDVANRFAPLIPQMLGADGQARNYLILAMTNSEIRSTGGFPGAQGLLTVSDGSISLGEFQKVVWAEGAEIPISEEEYVLFQGDGSSNNMTKTSGDSLYNPDFPRSASRVTQFWTAAYGGTVDGVIALDPVLLQYILGVTGGVYSPDGTYVDGTNAVKYLMSDVYWTYANDSKYQDLVFSEVAAAAFDKVVSSLGELDPAAFVSAVSKGVEEGRLLAWMQNENEEDAIASLGISGEISADPATAQVGVYVNDYSFTKAEYYLDFNTTVGESIKNGDGSTTYRMVTTATNTMPPELESQLPPYLTALSAYAVSPGDLLLRLYVYAPAGGTVNDISASGDASIEMKDGSYNGVNLSWGEVHLLPGETVTLTYTVTTSTQAGDVPLDVRSTPTVQDVRW